MRKSVLVLALVLSLGLTFSTMALADDSAIATFKFTMDSHYIDLEFTDGRNLGTCGQQCILDGKLVAPEVLDISVVSSTQWALYAQAVDYDGLPGDILSVSDGGNYPWGGGWHRFTTSPTVVMDPAGVGNTIGAGSPWNCSVDIRMDFGPNNDDMNSGTYDLKTKWIVMEA